jgi:hypothetical protein
MASSNASHKPNSQPKTGTNPGLGTLSLHLLLVFPLLSTDQDSLQLAAFWKNLLEQPPGPAIKNNGSSREEFSID